MGAHSGYTPAPGVANQGAWGGAPQVLFCRVCQSFPAAIVTIRRHQGLVLLMRFHKVPGPLCRHCGLALFRDFTTATLWQGWWSPISLVVGNPVTIISNLVARAKLLKLPEPDPQYRRTLLMPGKPVTRRWISLVGLVPLIWVAMVIVAGATGAWE